MTEDKTGANLSPGQASWATETELGSEVWEAAVAPRVPGLTVLYHPDLERVGERAVLTALGSGRRCELSRREPLFLPSARGGTPRPLDVARLSRQPLALTDAGGGVLLGRGGSRTSVLVDGEALEDRHLLAADHLEEGVVLLLGRSVVLLLHRLDPLPPSPPTFDLVGESPEMLRLREDVVRVADLEVPVLLRGETGSGKELAARAVHAAGPRKNGPFVAVNLAAVPPSLAAAELFGAARGAFTGADRARSGFFERASGGTLFLDEIGEAPTEIQVLLLRCLETGRFQPVGGERPVAANARIVAATDADLEAAVTDESFRAPLLHRLAGYTLRLPPLRRRREDLGRLLVHFLRRELEAVGESHRLAASSSRIRAEPWLPASVVAQLARFDWPGNVRQLANVVRQLVISNRGGERFILREPLETILGIEIGPESESGSTPESSPESNPGNTEKARSTPPAADPTTEGPERKPGDVTEAELLEALRASRWRPHAAARRLGIPRSSIYDLMAQSPKVRTAADLDREEIEASSRRHDGHVEAMAEDLEVSATALRRRMGQLGL